MLPQLWRAHEDAEKITDIGRPAHLDTERGPDDAAAGAAIDQVAGGDPKPLIVRPVVHGRDDVVGTFADRLKTMTMAELDVSQAPGEPGQEGIEKELIAALRAFRTLLDRLAATVGGALDAGDLVAGERRAIERRVRKVIRRARLVHRIGNAPAAHEFHRAGIQRGGARTIRQTFALLDQQAGRAAKAEIA